MWPSYHPHIRPHKLVFVGLDNPELTWAGHAGLQSNARQCLAHHDVCSINIHTARNHTTHFIHNILYTTFIIVWTQTEPFQRGPSLKTLILTWKDPVEYAKLYVGFQWPFRSDTWMKNIITSLRKVMSIICFIS